MEDNFYTKKEELMNSITHGIGACLSVAALVILIVFSVLKGSAWHVVSFTIYGTTLVILYLESTLYHSFTNKRVKYLFRKFDHMSIFLLIAGTYTPFCLTILRDGVGWIIFGIVWGCTVFGIVLKAFFVGSREILSTFLYIMMGWLIMIAIKPLYYSMSFNGFLFLVLGGVLYTLGAFFFIKEKIVFNHAIWHLFVMAGSTFHFFSVMSLLYIK